MKVAVTGAGGRLGRHVLAALEERHDVTAIDVRLPDDRHGRWVECDISDLEAVQRAIAGHQAVVHLAALVAGREAVALDGFIRVMVQGTWNLVEASAKSTVSRFVNVSSVSAGGWPDGGDVRVKTSERFAIGRADLYYALSKRLGEEVVNSYAETYPGISFVNIRPAIISDQPLELSESPEHPRTGRYRFVHVDPRDVAAAVRGALETVPSPAGTYSVSAPRADALFEFARAERDLGYTGRHTWESA